MSTGPAYVGPDRRTVTAADAGSRGAPFLLAGSVLLAVFGVATVAGAAGIGAPPSMDMVTVDAVLAGLTAALGLGVALLYGLRWRLTGETVSFRVSVALGVLAAGGYGTSTVAAMAGDGSADGVAAAVGAAAVACAAVLLAAAVCGPVIDTRVRPARYAWLAAAGLVLVPAFLAFPAPARLLGTSREAVLTAAPAESALIATALGLLGLVSTWRGLRGDRCLFTWFGLMLFGLALARVAGVGVLRDTELGPAVASLLTLTGMVFALYGGAQELRRAWVEQQDRLFEIQTEFLLEQARLQERRHDARSALFAMQGAVYGLGRAGENIAAEERASLTEALNAEINRLERLVAGRPEQAEPCDFDVATVLAPVVTCQRSTQLGLRADVPAGLVARGRADQTAEVVQLLLENARRHASGSPVTISAAREMENVVIRVEDRGPGVEPGEREAVFERGRKGSRGAGDGTGLGLHIARRLMREQGGDVWVEGRPGGGASLVLFLPVAGDRREPGSPRATELRMAEAR